MLIYTAGTFGSAPNTEGHLEPALDYSVDDAIIGVGEFVERTCPLPFANWFVYNLGFVKTKTPFVKDSNNITHEEREMIFDLAEDAYKSGCVSAGVIHGTTTLSVTAKRGIFNFPSRRGSIYYTGAMKSALVNPTDALENLFLTLFAMFTATDPWGDYVAFHRRVMNAVTAVKMHRGGPEISRDIYIPIDETYTFKSLNYPYIKNLLLSPNEVGLPYTSEGMKAHEAQSRIAMARFEKMGPVRIRYDNSIREECGIVGLDSNKSPEKLHEEASIYRRGVVIRASGPGEVSDIHTNVIRNLVKEGIPVVIAPEVVGSEVGTSDYVVGAQVLKYAVPASLMDDKGAQEKLAWSLGLCHNAGIEPTTENIYRLFLHNVAGEIDTNSLRGYIKARGLGMHEDEFIDTMVAGKKYRPVREDIEREKQDARETLAAVQLAASSAAEVAKTRTGSTRVVNMYLASIDEAIRKGRVHEFMQSTAHARDNDSPEDLAGAHAREFREGYPCGWLSRKKSRATVLAVDDHKIFAPFLFSYLESNGFYVLPAHSFREAAEVFKRYGDGADIVLTDIRLGDKSGVDLLEYVRGKSNVPVYGITWSGDTFKNVLRKGFDGVFTKSVEDIENMTKAFDKAVGIKSTRDDEDQHARECRA